MTTLSTTSNAAPSVHRRARPLWNPYVAGALLGLVLLATYLASGRGLGATAGFAALATWAASLASPEHVLANAVHLKYWNEGAPLANWTLVLLAGTFAGAALSGWQGRRFAWTIERGPRIGDGQRLALAFAGGFIAAWGAKIAKGCTSGQALTGSSMLNAGSLIFMAAVFAAGFAVASLVRKEWT